MIGSQKLNIRTVRFIRVNTTLAILLLTLLNAIAMGQGTFNYRPRCLVHMKSVELKYIALYIPVHFILVNPFLAVELLLFQMRIVSQDAQHVSISRLPPFPRLLRFLFELLWLYLYPPTLVCWS